MLTIDVVDLVLTGRFPPFSELTMRDDITEKLGVCDSPHYPDHAPYGNLCFDLQSRRKFACDFYRSQKCIVSPRDNSPLSVKWATSYLLVQNQVPFLLRSLFARPDRSGCQLPMQGSHPGRGLLVDVDHRKTLCHDRSPEQSNPGP